MKKASPQKGIIKEQAKPFPPILSWIYAITVMVLVPNVYYEPVLEATFVPKYEALGIVLLFFVFIIIFRKSFKFPGKFLLTNWALLFWFLLIVISIISLIKAINPSVGIFDICRLVLYALFLIITSSILINSNNIKPFIFSGIIMAVILTSAGFYEYFKFAFRHIDIDSLYKIKWLMSHKNIFMCILYLLTPFLYYQIITTKFRNKIVTTIILVFLLVLIYIVQTRAVWGALIVNTFVLSLFVFLFRKKIFKKNTRKDFIRGLSLIAFSLVFALAIAWMLTNYSLNNPKIALRSPKTNEVSKLDKRIASAIDSKSENFKRRIEIWEITLKMVRENPIIGIGAGNWSIAVLSYYSKDYLSTFYHNWRRPHNDFIWILAEKGIFALLSYICFFGFLLIYTIKILIKSKDPHVNIFVILMISGIAGYCADAFFSFPYERIELQIFLMLFASGIIWSYYRNFSDKKIKNKKTSTTFYIFAIVLLIILLKFGDIWIKSEINNRKAIVATSRGQWNNVIKNIDKAYSPITQVNALNIPLLYYSGSALVKLKQNDAAKIDLEKALKQNPNSVIVLTQLGFVYGMLEDFPLAIETFNKALDIYPIYKEALMYRGISYYFSGMYKESLNSLNLCKTNQKNEQLDKLIEMVFKKLEESNQSQKTNIK